MTIEYQGGIRRKILRLLLSRPLSELNAASVARELGVSESTMRRRLRAEGCSYQQLLDEVRRFRCDQLMRIPRVGGKWIAAELGFQQTNSFYRAFSSWTGIPWREYKRACAGIAQVQ